MNITKTFMLFTVSFICLLSTGCEGFIEDTVFNNRPFPADYVCDTKQLDLVKQEVDICSETGYLSDYCFAVAKSTICDEIPRDIGK